MGTEPRRITGIKVRFQFPDTVIADEKQKVILERAALTCPVAKSIHPDIQQDIEFGWAD